MNKKQKMQSQCTCHPANQTSVPTYQGIFDGLRIAFNFKYGEFAKQINRAKMTARILK